MGLQGNGRINAVFRTYIFSMGAMRSLGWSKFRGFISRCRGAMRSGVVVEFDTLRPRKCQRIIRGVW